MKDMFVELGKELRSRADKDQGLKNKISNFIRLYSTKLNQKDQIDRLIELIFLADVTGDNTHDLILVSASENEEEMKNACMYTIAGYNNKV